MDPLPAILALEEERKNEGSSQAIVEKMEAQQRQKKYGYTRTSNQKAK